MQPPKFFGGEGLSGLGFRLTVKTVHRSRTQIRCGFLSKLGMIRHLMDGLAWALKKGVASCDKLRVGACSLRSGDALMGLPAAGNTCSAPSEGWEPPERKHPSRGRKRNQPRFPEVAASEKGRVQTEPARETV